MAVRKCGILNDTNSWDNKVATYVQQSATCVCATCFIRKKVINCKKRKE